MSDLDDVYTVERIEDKRTRNGRAYYLIKWEGYDEKTWEPEANIIDKDLINEFNEKFDRKIIPVVSPPKERSRSVNSAKKVQDLVQSPPREKKTNVISSSDSDSSSAGEAQSKAPPPKRELDKEKERESDLPVPPPSVKREREKKFNLIFSSSEDEDTKGENDSSEDSDYKESLSSSPLQTSGFSHRAKCDYCTRSKPKAEECSVCTNSIHISCAQQHEANFSSKLPIKCSFCLRKDPSCSICKKKVDNSPIFRCSRCNDTVHFDCASIPKGKVISNFNCSLCKSFPFAIQTILARNANNEHYVKFEGKSYRSCQWVPAQWLERVCAAKFKNFSKLPAPPPTAEECMMGDYVRIEKILSYKNCPVNAEREVEEDADSEISAVKSEMRAFVKWKELGYAECTWETEAELVAFHKIEFFNALAEYKKSLCIFKQWNPPKSLCAEKDFCEFKETPAFFGTEKMLPHQLEGLNWITFNWMKGQSSMLADEMGLGKTIQTIAFLVNLQQTFNSFPFLIVSPTSVCQNWLHEFAKWAPSLQCAVYTGSQSERETITEYELFNKFIPKGSSKFPVPIKNHVIITSFSILARDKPILGKVPWEVIVVDEAHRLKGNGNQLSTILAAIRTKFKLILTGTPMQNNIRELFNVMRYIAPETFGDTEKLEEKFKDISQDPAKVAELHALVRPFMLRRTKKDVQEFYSIPPKAEIIIPVVMTAFQASIYKLLVEKNKNMLLSKLGSSAKKVSFLNLMMELRKCANHPLLCTTRNVSELSNQSEWTPEDIIKASGKLTFVMRILPALFEKGHRVLLFCGMTRLLDIIEDVLTQKEILHLRIDGNTQGDQRQKLVNAFNEPESKFQVFLLSTRAGGLGINLQSADSIIMYDSDFNPHQDLQAFSRAHRFGQEKNVVIYKLLTLNSVEEKIAQIANKKLLLDHVVVERMKEENSYVDDLKNENLFDILSCGLEGLFKSASASADNDQAPQIPTTYDDEMIEELTDFPALIAKYKANEDRDTQPGILKEGFKFAKIWETASTSPATSLTSDFESTASSSTQAAAEEPAESEDYFWSKILKSSSDSTPEETQEYGIGKRKRKQIDLSASSEDIPESLPKKDKEDELFQPEEEESEEDLQQPEVPENATPNTAGKQKKTTFPYPTPISFTVPERIVNIEAAQLNIPHLIHTSTYTKLSRGILLNNLKRIQFFNEEFPLKVPSTMGICWYVLSFAKILQDEGYLLLKMNLEHLFCNVLFISNQDLEALKAIIRQESFYFQILQKRLQMPQAPLIDPFFSKCAGIPKEFTPPVSSFKCRELSQEDVPENIAKSTPSNPVAPTKYKVFNITNDDLEMIGMIDHDFIGISAPAPAPDSTGNKGTVQREFDAVQRTPTPQKIIDRIKKDESMRAKAREASGSESGSVGDRPSADPKASVNDSTATKNKSINPPSAADIKNAFSPHLGKRVGEQSASEKVTEQKAEQKMSEKKAEQKGSEQLAAAQMPTAQKPSQMPTPVTAPISSSPVPRPKPKSPTTISHVVIEPKQQPRPDSTKPQSQPKINAPSPSQKRKIIDNYFPPAQTPPTSEIQSTLDTFSMEDLLANLERRVAQLKGSYSQIIAQSSGSSSNAQEHAQLQNHLLRTQNTALKAKVAREKKRSALSILQALPGEKMRSPAVVGETVWKCEWENCPVASTSFPSRDALIRHAVSKHL